MDEDELDETGGRRAVKTEVRLANLDDVPVEFANLFHVNFDPLVFQLVVSRAIQPMLTTEVERQRWSQAEAFDAEVLGRYILPPEVVEELIRLLRASLAGYFERYGIEVEADGGQEEGDDGDGPAGS